MEGVLQITVIATGFDGRPQPVVKTGRPAVSQPVEQPRQQMAEPLPRQEPSVNRTATTSADPYDVPSFLRNRQEHR